MLDELREQADQSSFFEEDDDDDDTMYFRTRYGSRRPFLGMAPGQRLVIALMLMLTTFVGGTLCLLVTGRVVPDIIF